MGASSSVCVCVCVSECVCVRVYGGEREAIAQARDGMCVNEIVPTRLC